MNANVSEMLMCALIPPFFVLCIYCGVHILKRKKILEAGTGLCKSHILVMLEVKSIAKMTGRRFSDARLHF